MTTFKAATLAVSAFIMLASPAFAASDTAVKPHAGSVLESSNSVPSTTGTKVEGALKAGTRDPVLTTADTLALEGMNFHASDVNGDGKLSTSEFTKAGLSSSIFGSVDANHDGVVTADELNTAAKSGVGSK
ncbi:MAG: hypothetical protein PW788_13120 [Micavibrio sp.]|nr:hypothetical protein [Micavibrio sp.]